MPSPCCYVDVVQGHKVHQPQSQKGLASPASSLLMFPWSPFNCADLASSRQEAFLLDWSEESGWPELPLFSAPSGWDILPNQAMFSYTPLMQVKVSRALSFWLFPWMVLRRQLHVNAGCGVMFNLLVRLCGHTCLQALIRTQKANRKPKWESSEDRL